MNTFKILFILSALFLLSAAVMAEDNGARITEKEALVNAIEYARNNLNASGDVTPVNVAMESGGRMYTVILKDGSKEFSLFVDSISGAVSVKTADDAGKIMNEVKQFRADENENRTGDNKIAGIESQAEKTKDEKKMIFASTGNNFSGKYVSFEYNNGTILHYMLGGREVFDLISIGGTGRMKAEGSVIRFETGEDEKKIELEIHDNPDGLMKISTDSNVSITFTLSAGIGANPVLDRVDMTGMNASIVSVGEEGRVQFMLSANILYATLDNAKIIFKAFPLTAKTEKEKELDDNVNEGVARGKIGAVVHVDDRDSSDVVTLSRMNVTVKDVKNKTVSINLSSDVSEGKTVVLSVSNEILGAVNPKEVKVFFDGAEIEQADNYSDVMADDKAKYLIVIGAKDVEALVSIPKFSEHEVTITTAGQITAAATDQMTTVPPRTPGFTIILAALSLAFLAWGFIRRK